MNNTSAADDWAAARNDDGSIVQETLDQVLPDELLSSVVESWRAFEAEVLNQKQNKSVTNSPDIGLSKT
jgi:hypothetical protein